MVEYFAEDARTDDVGLGIDLFLQLLGAILLAGLHDVAEEQTHIEDMVVAVSADEVLRIEIGQHGRTMTLALQLVGRLALRIKLGLDELLLRAEIGDALLVEGKLHLLRDVVLAGVGLRPSEDTLARLATLIDLEGFVLQLRSYPSAQVAVLGRLVLVEHTDNAAPVGGGQVHEPLDDVLGYHTVVDVGHQVADAIEHNQVGTVVGYSRLEQRQTLGKGLAAHVEDVEPLHGKTVLGDACHRDDAVLQDVLRRLLALFGIVPQHVQGSLVVASDRE